LCKFFLIIQHQTFKSSDLLLNAITHFIFKSDVKLIDENAIHIVALVNLWHSKTTTDFWKRIFIIYSEQILIWSLKKWFKSLYYSISYSQKEAAYLWTRLFILYSNQTLIWSMKAGIKYFLLFKFELSKSDDRHLKANNHFIFKYNFILIDDNSIEIFELFVVIISKRDGIFMNSTIHFIFKSDFDLIIEKVIQIFELFHIILSNAEIYFWIRLLILSSKPILF
jgi:hypothetical protein